jgi:hypothetical protein
MRALEGEDEERVLAPLLGHGRREIVASRCERGRFKVDVSD